MYVHIQYVFTFVLLFKNRARKSIEAHAGRVLALRSSPDYLLISNHPWTMFEFSHTSTRIRIPDDGRNENIESVNTQLISEANVLHISATDHVQVKISTIESAEDLETEMEIANSIKSTEDEEEVIASMTAALKAVHSSVTTDARSAPPPLSTAISKVTLDLSGAVNG